MNIQDQINAIIARCGWMVQGVFDPEGRKPGFAYTIGATETLHAPEILAFALPPQYAAQILNSVMAKVVAAGAPLPDGTVLDDIANLPCVLRDIPVVAAAEHCAQALYRYEGGSLAPRFQQLVLPDEEGRFPWDAGYDSVSGKMALCQPELWKPVTTH